MFFRVLKACLLVFFLDSSAAGEDSISFMKVLHHFQIVNPNIFIQHSSKIGLSKTNMLKKLFQNRQSGTVSFIDKWNFNSSSSIRLLPSTGQCSRVFLMLQESDETHNTKL
jgi:hypothetical protein